MQVELTSQSWKQDVLEAAQQIQKAVGEGNTFTLVEVYYRAEPVLRAKHPNNKHVGPKIRQTLQVLRNEGHVEFLGKGNYRLVSDKKREMSKA